MTYKELYEKQLLISDSLEQLNAELIRNNNKYLNELIKLEKENRKYEDSLEEIRSKILDTLYTKES